MTEIKTSPTVAKLIGALIELQSEMGFALKDTRNEFFKSSYADLATIWQLCQPLLTKNKIASVQTMGITEASYDIQVFDRNKVLTGDYKGTHQNTLVTTIYHESGEWMSSEALINAIKPDPQANGSAITYMRRYQLCAILGIIQHDDDGEKSMNRQKEPPATKQPEAIQEKDKKDFEDFVAKHHIRDEVLLIHQFVKDGAKNRKLTFEEMLRLSYQNKESFLLGFKKYEKECHEKAANQGK